MSYLNLMLAIVVVRGIDDRPEGGLADDSAASAMRRAVKSQLAEGRVGSALLAAQRSISENPDDASVRREFVSLHLSLARELIRVEDFATADRALAAIRAVDANAAEAGRLAGRIDAARRATPSTVAKADRWMTVEWFDPAFRAYGQAVALLPGREPEWRDRYLDAAVGAGDDHYFTKNFHEAFYRYDAAMQLYEKDGRPATGRLKSRWLQSMIHALSDDIDRVGYPPAYWKIVLGRVERAGSAVEMPAMYRWTVRGLALEDMGETGRAAEAYGRVSGRPVSDASREGLARVRASAIKRIRGAYDKSSSDRRRGVWSELDRGPWQVLEVGRFRIHHRNEGSARRLADALEFQFVRIAAILGRTPDEVPWARPCDVHLHADSRAFREATEQEGLVQAISVIRTRGANLESHVIHGSQDDPLLLSSSMPHELSHLMVGALTGYRPMPGALAEGLALHVEPRCRQIQFARVFSRLTRSRSVRALLRVGEFHPSESAFYAESHRLVAVLSGHGDVGLILELHRSGDNRVELARRFGFKSAGALDRAYLGRKAR
ncbi:MAG: hypothetical protein O7D94_06670 [Planctomycetota bacterium]|nr:hypothetical protein [Planctomycetota bacterium]